MSGKNLQMSSEAQTVFTYTEFCFKLTLELNFSAFTDHIFKSVWYQRKGDGPTHPSFIYCDIDRAFKDMFI